MKEYSGISASPGIAIGKAFLYVDNPIKIPKYDIGEEEIDAEIDRFNNAIERATQEIHELKEKTSEEIGEEENKFLDSHVLMLADPEFQERVSDSIKKYLKNVEWILFQVVDEIVEKLNASKDSYLQERTVDFHDVAKRVLNHLLYTDRISLSDISEEVILITHNLLPSDAVAMNKRKIKAIAMDMGGKTSHTAILARSFEIPAVLGLSKITSDINTGDEIIVDGNKGKVIVNPDKATKAEYIRSLQEWQRREVQLLTMNELPAETKDGKLIFLKANIEVPEEIESVLAHGSSGIGLYRSEFLFLGPGKLAPEEEQYRAYSKVVKAMKGKPVTIRTLDIGGDKIIPDIEGLDEKNPILGWRAVRFCLTRIDIFKAQLRALLRASVHGDLRIMFPMISGLEELNNALEVVESVKADLRNEGVPFNEEIPIGIMIEVPSAALSSDILARKVQFFSIGTNDLIQYTIAVDRGNEKIAYLYEPFHPGVLRLIKTIIDNAHNYGIPVSMCGEMAGDPNASVILLGLGLDEFSMSAFGIPEIKRIVRSVSMAEAEELVGTIMEMRSCREIDEYVTEWMEERFDKIGY
ncbi:MAG: phosphoenolpyruvate--protein phosphotransferase [Spirochaetia bacterium]